MEDFNGLLHDQQMALLQAQFGACVRRQPSRRNEARVIARRISAHAYPYRAGTALCTVLSHMEGASMGQARA